MRFFSLTAVAAAALLSLPALTHAQTGHARAADLAPASSSDLPWPATNAPATGETPNTSTLPADEAETGGFTPNTSTANAFTIRLVLDDEDLHKLLDDNLELKRYQKVNDLDTAELRMLFAKSEINIRQLLATQGYFTPTIQQELKETNGSKPEAVIVVTPGPATQVDRIQLQLNGAIQETPSARPQIRAIRTQWPLPSETVFTQAKWTEAKANTLGLLQARRFPTAKLENSRAAVNPDTSTVDLALDYNSGPVFRYGDVVVSGHERYDPVIARRFTNVTEGKEYRLNDMVEAQQRLLDSGYYDSALVSIDTSPGVNPDKAPVLVQLQEAKLQRLVTGVGFSTDSGPRLSMDHTHNKVPILGWRAISALSLDRKQQSIGSSLIAPPNDNLWRWTLSGNASREDLNDYKADNQQVRFGRLKQENNIDRTWYFAYDHSARTYIDNTRESAQALSGNFIWTYRRFNNRTFPTSGYGFAVEMGGGVTTQPQTRPFVRAGARYLTFFSLDRPWQESLRRSLPTPSVFRAVARGDAQAMSTESTQQLLEQTPTRVVRRKNGELVLRVEGAGVWAKDDAVFPSNLLFLTGGNATVRGYGYQSIGATTRNNLTTPGRFMFASSLEYRRPFTWNGKPTDWDSVAYIDAGSVADSINGLGSLQVGVGVGALWRSPVGPVQVSIARGVQSKQFRLHLNLGFRF